MRRLEGDLLLGSFNQDALPADIHLFTLLFETVVAIRSEPLGCLYNI